jgi:drug/metabolite transporter (DMT)-like permease
VYVGLALAALSALVFGCGDFAGGKATRKTPVATVTFFSQLCGLVILGIGLLFKHGDGPRWNVLGWGALGGLGGAVGILLLYHALSIGTMSIVSPITAVTGAAVPVLVGVVIHHERPKLLAIVGIVFALCAIALVSRSVEGSVDSARSSPKILAFAAGAGFGFGLFFVFLQQAGSPEQVGLWGLVGARPVSIAVAAVLAFRNHQPLLPTRGERRKVALAGCLDQAANVIYVFAIGRALLSLIGVLASLYPVSTVALARLIDHERLHRIQIVGLAFAFLGLGLIAV